MTVPGRVEAAELLLSLDPPAWFLGHSRAVAEVAAWLAARRAAAGHLVDRRLVEAAALLHDADKLLPDAEPARALRHGEGSADWLARQGYPELGPTVAAHPVSRLADDAWYMRWVGQARPEERIVAYADKRAGQRLESMAARFAIWRLRYPEGWSEEVAATVRRRAERLEAEVCAAAWTRPADVRRLAWTGAALHAAAAARS
jgi:hypothetical protein